MADIKKASDASEPVKPDASVSQPAIFTSAATTTTAAPPQQQDASEKKQDTTSAPTATTDKADADSEDEDGNEVLEESPCGRWQKRREQVRQRDVPGIDAAYLAMDNDEGVEVVWNEVQFSERKNFKAQEEKIKAVFDNLTQLQHANLVKFHKYWTDTTSEKPRVIFITEYMSSGSMSQFLKQARQSNTALSGKAWKKWCTQILSALSYLHSCDPPIVHGNLTCNTIFIQHNGLVKIGCVAPDAIHHHVKTFRENMKSMHYIAPEFEVGSTITPAADIYSYGICALEMAILGLASNGEGAAQCVSPDLIQKKIDSLEWNLQRDFIQKCLGKDPLQRPTARELLFHSVLFEVHSLKLLAAHVIVTNPQFDNDNAASTKDEPDKRRILAEIIRSDSNAASYQLTADQVQAFEVDKFLEDVKNGIYPLTAFAHPIHRPGAATTTDTTKQSAPAKPAQASSAKASTKTNESTVTAPSDTAKVVPPGGEPAPSPGSSPTEKQHTENRRIIQMSAEAALKDTEVLHTFSLRIILRMDDSMNRHLTCEVKEEETPGILADELVFHGFIHTEDCQLIARLIDSTIRKLKENPSTSPVVVDAIPIPNANAVLPTSKSNNGVNATPAPIATS